MRTPKSTIEHEPLAVPAVNAARMCGVSRALWFKLRSAGKIPAPVYIGGARSPRWIVAELRAWLNAGCPELAAWKRIREQEMSRVQA